MPFPITAIYTAVLTLMLIALFAHVTRMRAQTKISILHGDNIALAERIRAHGNFTENVPMALIAMAFAEAGGAPASWLHAIGIMLVAGRVMHPFGLKHDEPTAPLRIIGNSLTSLSMLGSVYLIVSNAM